MQQLCKEHILQPSSLSSLQPEVFLFTEYKRTSRCAVTTYVRQQSMLEKRCQLTFPAPLGKRGVVCISRINHNLKRNIVDEFFSPPVCTRATMCLSVRCTVSKSLGKNFPFQESFPDLHHPARKTQSVIVNGYGGRQMFGDVSQIGK